MKWLLLLTKRNFKKISFLFILLLIPTVSLVITQMTRNAGISKVGYVCDGKEDEMTSDIFDTLSEGAGILSMKQYNTVEKATLALNEGEIDILWVFPEDLLKKTESYYQGKETHLITVLERENNIVSELASEKLFCILYPYLSRSMFSDYMRNNIPEADKLSEKEMAAYFNYSGLDSNIVEIKTIDALGNESSSNGDILTSPLRGILSVLVLLAGLTAAAFTVTDIKRGLLSSFSPMKRLWISCLSILSSLIPSLISFQISVSISGLSQGAFKELLQSTAMLLSYTALCVFLTVITNSPETIGGITPPLTILSLAVSPIFINLRLPQFVQCLFPTSLYLNSQYDPRCTAYLLLYTLILSLASISLTKIKK